MSTYKGGAPFENEWYRVSSRYSNIFVHPKHQQDPYEWHVTIYKPSNTNNPYKFHFMVIWSNLCPTMQPKICLMYGQRNLISCQSFDGNWLILDSNITFFSTINVLLGIQKIVERINMWIAPYEFNKFGCRYCTFGGNRSINILHHGNHNNNHIKTNFVNMTQNNYYNYNNKLLHTTPNINRHNNQLSNQINTTANNRFNNINNIKIMNNNNINNINHINSVSNINNTTHISSISNINHINNINNMNSTNNVNNMGISNNVINNNNNNNNNTTNNNNNNSMNSISNSSVVSFTASVGQNSVGSNNSANNQKETPSTKIPVLLKKSNNNDTNIISNSNDNNIYNYDDIKQEQDEREKKRLIGDRLFHKIKEVEPNLTGKITGMLLELKNNELFQLLDNNRLLRDKVNEALGVLQKHRKAQNVKNNQPDNVIKKQTSSQQNMEPNSLEQQERLPRKPPIPPNKNINVLRYPPLNPQINNDDSSTDKGVVVHYKAIGSNGLEEWRMTSETKN